MALILELGQETETLLLNQAQASGLAPGEYVTKLVREHAPVEAARERNEEERDARIEEILRQLHELPTLDDRSADEIIGYDEWGLPYK